MARSAIPAVLAAVVCVTAQNAAAATTSARPSSAEIYFRLQNPCPASGQTAGPCKGYVVDRIIPRACGGPEEPSNMQWQTIAEAKEKDRWERIGCRPGRKLVLPGQNPGFLESQGTGEAVEPVQAEPLPPR